MKTLYIECNMGAAGDMLMAALSEITEAPEDFVTEMNALGLPGVKVEREQAVRCGIAGTHMKVTVDGAEEHEHHHHGDEEEHEHHHHGDEEEHEHHHHGDEEEHEHHHHGDEEEHEHHHMDGHAHMDMDAHDGAHIHAHVHGEGHAHHHAALADVAALINGLEVSEAVKHNALHVYNLIADAEAAAHGRPVDQIHFHEVGTADAVADVVGVCLLMEKTGAERVIVSPVNVGSGMVHCAHGVLPVPAPATAHILRGVPIYSGRVRSELCTPTGAALLRHFGCDFGPMPIMRVEKIGYGMGSKDFPVANFVRVYLGECDN